MADPSTGSGWPSSVPPDIREIAERLLTAKQLEVYKLFARGYGRRRISLILGLSEGAIRDRLYAAERKVFNELDRQADEHL